MGFPKRPVFKRMKEIIKFRRGHFVAAQFKASRQLAWRPVAAQRRQCFTMRKLFERRFGKEVEIDSSRFPAATVANRGPDIAFLIYNLNAEIGTANQDLFGCIYKIERIAFGKCRCPGRLRNDRLDGLIIRWSTIGGHGMDFDYRYPVTVTLHNKR